VYGVVVLAEYQVATDFFGDRWVQQFLWKCASGFYILKTAVAQGGFAVSRQHHVAFPAVPSGPR
jgi:hypothetical protein